MKAHLGFFLISVLIVSSWAKLVPSQVKSDSEGAAFAAKFEHFAKEKDEERGIKDNGSGLGSGVASRRFNVDHMQREFPETRDRGWPRDSSRGSSRDSSRDGDWSRGSSRDSSRDRGWGDNDIRREHPDFNNSWDNRPPGHGQGDIRGPWDPDNRPRDNPGGTGNGNNPWDDIRFPPRPDHWHDWPSIVTEPPRPSWPWDEEDPGNQDGGADIMNGDWQIDIEINNNEITGSIKPMTPGGSGSGRPIRPFQV